MTTSHTALHDEDWGGRLSPGDVHDALFTRAGLGRRGYEEAEVDVFLERVQQELTRLIAEKRDLRDEVFRLKGQLTLSGHEPVAAGGLNNQEAQLQAVRLLAAAQQTADTYVADAEKYSQRVAADAREHSEGILGEARSAAQQLVEQAQHRAHPAAQRTVEGETLGLPEPSKQELDQQIIYLKTFSQVCRVQLRAYLEALLRDVEDEWGKADPGVVLRAPAPRETPELEAAAAALPSGGSERTADTGPPEQPPRDAGATGSALGHEAEDPAGQGLEVDLADPDPVPNGVKPRRRSATVSHSR